MAEAQLRASRSTFLTTQKGKKKLSLNGFRYTIDRTRDSTTYWKCETRECRGRVIQRNDSEYDESKEHNHAPDPAQSLVSINR
jgi:hypothetical protein